MVLKTKKDERGTVLEQMSAINKSASEEKRSLNEQEQKQWDELTVRLDVLDKEIARLEKAAEIEARMAGAAGVRSGEGPEQKELKKFSLVKFINEAGQRKLTGFEAEMHQEAEKEARENGFAIKNYGVPSIIMENRNTVTGGTQPADGSQIVKDEASSMIGLLKNAQVLRALGARFLTGLKGNLPFDRLTQGATSSWATENATLATSKLQFSGAEMTPHRLGTLATPSKQLLIQSSYDVEQMLRQELMESIAIAVDLAGINGSGAANQPTGVLNTAGIGDVAIGTNGGVPTRSHIVQLEGKVDIQNALMGNLKYAFNGKVKNQLKETLLDAGSGRFVLESNSELNGYGYVNSNAIPSNLTKGTSAGNCSAILFGNWSDLIVGQWGGLDVMVDPYTLAAEGKYRVIVDSFWDVFVRRVQSFAAIKDATTTL